MFFVLLSHQCCLSTVKSSHREVFHKAVLHLRSKSWKNACGKVLFFFTKFAYWRLVTCYFTKNDNRYQNNRYRDNRDPNFHLKMDHKDHPLCLRIYIYTFIHLPWPLKLFLHIVLVIAHVVGCNLVSANSRSCFFSSSTCISSAVIFSYITTFVSG